jgi:GMP synthase (glutamine-hydrolysing)
VTLAPLICVRNQPGDDLGVGDEVLRSEGIPIRYVDAWREPVPASETASGLVVLGGEMNADETDRYPFLASVREALRRAVDQGVPVLGICLGAQLLARSLGAAVVPSPAVEVGFFPIRTADDSASDPLLSSYRDGDLVFQWHRDTFELPAAATLVLTGDRVPHQAFRVGDRAWGVQFHLEVTRLALHRWVDLMRDSLEPQWGRRPDELLRETDRHLESQQRRSGEIFSRLVSLIRTRERQTSPSG